MEHVVIKAYRIKIDTGNIVRYVTDDGVTFHIPEGFSCMIIPDEVFPMFVESAQVIITEKNIEYIGRLKRTPVCLPCVLTLTFIVCKLVKIE